MNENKDIFNENVEYLTRKKWKIAHCIIKRLPRLGVLLEASINLIDQSLVKTVQIVSVEQGIRDTELTLYDNFRSYFIRMKSLENRITLQDQISRLLGEESYLMTFKSCSRPDPELRLNTWYNLHTIAYQIRITRPRDKSQRLVKTWRLADLIQIDLCFDGCGIQFGIDIRNEIVHFTFIREDKWVVKNIFNRCKQLKNDMSAIPEFSRVEQPLRVSRNNSCIDSQSRYVAGVTHGTTVNGGNEGKIQTGGCSKTVMEKRFRTQSETFVNRHDICHSVDAKRDSHSADQPSKSPDSSGSLSSTAMNQLRCHIVDDDEDKDDYSEEASYDEDILASDFEDISNDHIRSVTVPVATMNQLQPESWKKSYPGATALSEQQLHADKVDDQLVFLMDNDVNLVTTLTAEKINGFRNQKFSQENKAGKNALVNLERHPYDSETNPDSKAGKTGALVNLERHPFESVSRAQQSTTDTNSGIGNSVTTISTLNDVGPSQPIKRSSQHCYSQMTQIRQPSLSSQAPTSDISRPNNHISNSHISGDKIIICTSSASPTSPTIAVSCSEPVQDAVRMSKSAESQASHFDNKSYYIKLSTLRAAPAVRNEYYNIQPSSQPTSPNLRSHNNYYNLPTPTSIIPSSVVINQQTTANATNSFPASSSSSSSSAPKRYSQPSSYSQTSSPLSHHHQHKNHHLNYADLDFSDFSDYSSYPLPQQQLDPTSYTDDSVNYTPIDHVFTQALFDTDQYIFSPSHDTLIDSDSKKKKSSNFFQKIKLRLKINGNAAN